MPQATTGDETFWRHPSQGVYLIDTIRLLRRAARVRVCARFAPTAAAQRSLSLFSLPRERKRKTLHCHGRAKHVRAHARVVARRTNCARLDFVESWRDTTRLNC